MGASLVLCFFLLYIYPFRIPLGSDSPISQIQSCAPLLIIYHRRQDRKELYSSKVEKSEAKSTK
ncbi:hypothetical protein N7447_007404 [Penicillium robsamsonii]|uniref:uncharacterized protein n=1 Tax=Penicillium robsamsonii TaxID=1792511 RepID=UPI00254696CB|nr:uncharacterized protein N7447_007404 [Penicillium robsamsonii]KAJ5825064.1 hypothetical protein N7447_007404 [Penicillium robsamsonii]